MAQHHWVVFFDTKTKQWGIAPEVVGFDTAEPVFDEKEGWRFLKDSEHAKDDRYYADLVKRLEIK